MDIGWTQGGHRVDTGWTQGGHRVVTVDRGWCGEYKSYHYSNDRRPLQLEGAVQAERREQGLQVQQGWTAWKYILAHALYQHSHVNLKTVRS